MNGARNDQDDQLLDALLAAAMEDLQAKEPDLDDLSKLQSNLTDDDLRELRKIGPDTIARITGRAMPQSVGDGEFTVSEVCPQLELAAAMNRGSKDEISEKAREEIERKIREARKREHEGDACDGTGN